MDPMKQATETLIENIKRTVLRRVLERRLKDENVSISEEALESLETHVLSGRSEQFTWKDGPESVDRSIELTFTKADAREVEDGLARIMAALPEILTDVARTTAQEICESLHERWPTEKLRQEQEKSGFQHRLEQRWNVGLSNLRMLLTCSREIGHDVSKRHAKTQSKRHMYRRWVMVRLHTRACQVTDEIICLLENGFADGAMARWRTLHEISVVAILIADGDEDLAERYMLHDAVEVKRQADGYDEVQHELGLSGLGKRARDAINRTYDDVNDRFGPEFRSPYGWAAQHLNHKKPTFKELQEAADRAAMRNDYKVASFNVHASARSLFFSLSSIGPSAPLIAGRSNAGLDEPGALVARSMTLMTALYMGSTPNLRRLTEMSTLVQLRNAAVEGFAKASRRLLWEARTPQASLPIKRVHRSK